MPVNFNSVTVLTAIQTLLAGVTVFWAGEALGNPEPAQFVVLEGGFDTPSYQWGELRSNSKIDRIRVVTTTARQRDALIDTIISALPEHKYGVTSVTRSTGKIGTPPNDRFEAVLNVNTVT